MKIVKLYNSSEEDMGELLKEPFVSSSLWLMKKRDKVYIKSSNRSLMFLLLLLRCCDIHPLPGPYMEQLESSCKQRGLTILQQNI